MATAANTSYPRVAGNAEFDVVVVGGGIAGLCVAWELVQTGRSVAVVEAGRIASATTGYTTAKLTALHTLVYAKLTARLGPESAALYARSQQDALEHVVTTVANLGIDCDLERQPAFTYVTSAQGAEDIRAEARAAASAGLNAEFVTESGLPFPIAAAVRVADQAQFHPRKFLLALAADIVGRGGQIFERSRAISLKDGSQCLLTTDAGATLTAGNVVVTTGFPVFDRPELFTRLLVRRELVVAAPIQAAADPAGMYLTTEDNIRSVRTTPLDDEQRLLIVTGEHFTPGSEGVEDRYQRLIAWTRQHFGDLDMGYRWSAQDYATTDGIPFAGRFPGKDHVWVATGFGGWGMTNAVMAGQLLASRIDGHDPAWSGLYDPHRLHPVTEARQLAKAATNVLSHAIGSRLTRPEAASAEQVAAGHGAIVTIDGHKCAVYRDGSGHLHAVSATCTHLGCIVGFNDAERTWECPCHGSRFSVDGAVLQGPALKPLPARAIDAG